MLHLLALSRSSEIVRSQTAYRSNGKSTGGSLKGLRVAVVGDGRIGEQIVCRLRPFGVELIRVGPAENQDDRDPSEFVFRRPHQELATALTDAGALILCSDEKEADGLIGHAELRPWHREP
jgi:phosphoglycerate dehydrogenase-like enzyme